MVWKGRRRDCGERFRDIIIMALEKHRHHGAVLCHAIFHLVPQYHRACRTFCPVGAEGKGKPLGNLQIINLDIFIMIPFKIVWRYIQL